MTALPAPDVSSAKGRNEQPRQPLLLSKAPHRRSANVTRVRSQGLHDACLCSPGWGRLGGRRSIRTRATSPLLEHRFARWPGSDSRRFPGEDPAELEALTEAYHQEWQPSTYLERFLVILSFAPTGSFSSYDGWKPNSGAITSRMLVASSSTNWTRMLPLAIRTAGCTSASPAASVASIPRSALTIARSRVAASYCLHRGHNAGLRRL